MTRPIDLAQVFAHREQRRVREPAPTPAAERIAKPLDLRSATLDRTSQHDLFTRPS